MEENQTNFGGHTMAPEPTSTESEKSGILYKRPVGPITFGLIVLMFFFTFIDIKCNNVSLGTVKGYELATGYHISKGSGEGTHKQTPNLFAAGALFLAVLGFGLAFLKAKPGSIARVACGFVGFLNMVLLFLTIKYDASKQNRGGGDDNPFASSIKISVDFQLAFWIATLLFLFGAIVGLLSLIKKKT